MSNIENKINKDLGLKEIHRGLIDKQGRRKYFSLLNPKLEDSPFEIDIKSIKKKTKNIIPFAKF